MTLTVESITRTMWKLCTPLSQPKLTCRPSCRRRVTISGGGEELAHTLSGFVISTSTARKLTLLEYRNVCVLVICTGMIIIVIVVVLLLLLLLSSSSGGGDAGSLGLHPPLSSCSFSLNTYFNCLIKKIKKQMFTCGVWVVGVWVCVCVHE